MWISLKWDFFLPKKTDGSGNLSKNVFPKAIKDGEFEDVGNTCDNHTPQDAHDVIDQGKYKGADVRGGLCKERERTQGKEEVLAQVFEENEQTR